VPALLVVIALPLAVGRSTVKHLVDTPGRDFLALFRIAGARGWAAIGCRVETGPIYDLDGEL